MNLMAQAMEKFVMLDKRRVPDGFGGATTAYVDGAEIMAAVAFDQSMEARTAQKQGVTSVYTIYLRKGVDVDYHDVIRRVSDGAIFRITSDGNEKQTPSGAGLNLQAVTAEEWELPVE